MTKSGSEPNDRHPEDIKSTKLKGFYINAILLLKNKYSNGIIHANRTQYQYLSGLVKRFILHLDRIEAAPDNITSEDIDSFLELFKS